MEEEKKDDEPILPEHFQDLILTTYGRLKPKYGSQPMFADLFTVDEQMDMWDRMNGEQSEAANRLLTEGTKHGN